MNVFSWQKPTNYVFTVLVQGTPLLAVHPNIFVSPVKKIIILCSIFRLILR